MSDNRANEEGWDLISDENNPGELEIALRNIRKAVERGVDPTVARKRHGIPGHPYFEEFWPVTKYWGDAAFKRQELYGKGPNED
jgi:hypothetical protein